MSFLWMIVVGLIIGGIAKLLMPERSPAGWGGIIILGIGGSVLAGVLGWAEHWYAQGEPTALVASAVGALLLLVVYRASIPRGPKGRRDLRRAA